MSTAALSMLDLGSRGLVRHGEDPAARLETVCGARWSSVPARRKSGIRAAMVVESPVSDCDRRSSGSAFLKRKGGDGDRRRRNSVPVSPEKLDEWTRQSVIEIVRNMGEAPFLVHMFSNDRSEGEFAVSTSSSSSVRLETEPALPLSWPGIKGRWEEGDQSPPDGIILVEELKDEEKCRDEVELRVEKSTRTWGLLVQGRGLDCTACYILNTCRVLSSIGASTHFCLVRAECFGDTAAAQLRKSWLL